MGTNNKFVLVGAFLCSRPSLSGSFLTITIALQYSMQGVYIYDFLNRKSLTRQETFTVFMGIPSVQIIHSPRAVEVFIFSVSLALVPSLLCLNSTLLLYLTEAPPTPWTRQGDMILA